jgi:hypothetical protein
MFSKEFGEYIFTCIICKEKRDCYAKDSEDARGVAVQSGWEKRNEGWVCPICKSIK